MAKENKSDFSGLKFNGKASGFQRWKDAEVAHLTQMTNRRRVTEIQAGRSAPTLGYHDLLTNPATVPAIGEEATEEQRNQHVLESAFLQEQESYLRDLFNQTLPHGYMTQLSVPLASQPVPQFWRQLEADFGQNNAMGMVELIAEFERTLATNFSSISELFQRLRAVRNRLNRQGQETLHVHLLPSQLMIGKVLALIPSHLWGPSVTFTPEEFTLEKAEKKMKSIFGSKSRGEIQAMGKAATSVPVNYAASAAAGGKRAPAKKLGKRKAGLAEDACFYCKGKYNDMNGVGPHFKHDCPKRDHDMALGIGRKDIHSEPKPLKIRKTDAAKAQKVQPSKPAPRVEIPVDAASLQRFSTGDSGITEAEKGDLPVTPGRDTTPGSPVVSSGPDSDEDMDDFDGKEVVSVNNAKVTAVAEELEEKAKILENTDAAMD